MDYDHGLMYLSLMVIVWKKSNGFTLLEILVSIGLLATGFLGLLSAQGSAFLSSERAELLSTATFLARSRMAELEIELEKDFDQNKFPDESQAHGQFEEPYDGFRWQYTVSKVQIPVAGGGQEGQLAVVQDYMKNIADKISESVRHVELMVLWGDPDQKIEDQPKIVVTTHIVDLK